MNLPPFVRVQPDDVVLLSLKVQPRASKNEISETVGNELKIRITAPPIDSAANEALLRFLSQKVDCPASAVRLVRGATSRHKIVAIHGLAPADILERLSK